MKKRRSRNRIVCRVVVKVKVYGIRVLWKVYLLVTDDNLERMMNRHGMALSSESIPHIRRRFVQLP